MTFLHILFFLLGVLFGVGVYQVLKRKPKKRVIESIGPDEGKVRFAVEIHSYDIRKEGTSLNMVIRDENTRSLFSCRVPDELPKRFPPGEKYYLTLEMEK